MPDKDADNNKKPTTQKPGKAADNPSMRKPGPDAPDLEVLRQTLAKSPLGQIPLLDTAASLALPGTYGLAKGAKAIAEKLPDVPEDAGILGIGAKGLDALGLLPSQLSKQLREKNAKDREQSKSGQDQKKER